MTADLHAAPAPLPCTLRWASDRALEVVLPLRGEGPEAAERANDAAVAAWRRLAAARLPGVRDVAPTWTTVVLTVDPLAIEPATLEASVRSALARADTGTAATAAPIEIPVCYDPRVAPDLAAVAEHADLAPAEVARRHVAAIYAVAFLGFAPGFGYLRGLPPELAAPRLPSPRRRVPAGSVAIGGSAAAVYPLDSPGGWRIVGRTPLRLFDPRREPMALLAPGVRVRFAAIDFETLLRLDPKAADATVLP